MLDIVIVENTTAAIAKIPPIKGNTRNLIMGIININSNRNKLIIFKLIAAMKDFISFFISVAIKIT